MDRLAATPTVSQWRGKRPPAVTVEAGRRLTDGSESDGSESDVFVRGELVAGRFRVEQCLGRGGFAEVYRAVDRSLGQRVALKVLRPRAARRRDALDALRREVLYARAVTHPNVCRIYDVFEHDTEDVGDLLPAGRLVVAMEWVEGPTLGERLRCDGPMTPSEGLELARQLAAALDAAHDAGVLHLDLKSANILMAPQPDGGFRAVVTDFGLAEGLRSPGEATPDSTPRGTPGYMAPEQRLGGPYSRATDVYALGCVLHEAIVGEVPRRDAAGASVPESWRRVLDRCHRLDPDGRPQSAGAVVAALEPPRGSVRRLVATWTTVGALALAAAWGLTAGVVRSTSPTTAVAVSADLPADWASPWVSDLPADDERRTDLLAARDALRRLDPVVAVELADAVVAALPETARGACLARLTSAWAWNARGRVTRSFGIIDAAEIACRSAAPATRLLASTLKHAASGAEQQALDGFTTLGTLFPAEPEYSFGLVQVALELGALDTARASLDRLEAAVTDATGSDATGHDAALSARLLLWRARVERTAGAAAAQLDAGLAAVAAAEAAGLDLLRAQALVEVGRARRQLALPGFGLEEGRAARVTFERAGDDLSVMLVRRWLAMTRLHLGDPAADAVLAEAEAFYAAIGHPLAGAAATVARGRIALFARDGARARPFFEQALAVYERLDRAREQAGLHRDLAFVAHGRGALAEAEASYRTALDMVRAAGREASVANLLNNLGIVYGERGELRRALDTFAESERLADQRSQRLIASLAGVNRGRILIRRGEVEAARALLARIAELQATFDGVEATRLGSALALTRGDLARVDGDFEAAAAIYRQARQEAEERGDAF
ncbi:MAG: serine/threonine-protein kinase, partial [Acidobacteriota bacterium]